MLPVAVNPPNCKEDPEIAETTCTELLIRPAGFSRIFKKSLASFVNFSFPIEEFAISKLAVTDPEEILTALLNVTFSVKLTVSVPALAVLILLTFNILIFNSTKVYTPPYKYHFIYKEVKKASILDAFFNINLLFKLQIT